MLFRDTIVYEVNSNVLQIRMKKIWIAVLVLSIIAFFAIAAPCFEVYFGINMPFVDINMQKFNVYGYDIPSDKQLGIMMLCGVLLMLPGRLIHLAMIKLGK